MTPHASDARFRGRLTLLLIAAMFLGSFGVAAYLRFTGWRPAHGKNYGDLLQPPIDLSSAHLARADGTPYLWSPDRNVWRIAVFPGEGCEQPCAKVLDSLHRIWLNQGRKADRIDVLWFGTVPAQGPHFRRLVPMRKSVAVSNALPGAVSAQGVPVFLIDPSGFVALHYRPGFDPAGLRSDIGKLVK